MSNEETFKDLYRRYIHREGAEALLAWLEQETNFFTAPASTRHHLAYPGGLVEHSLNVFRELRKVVIDNEPTMEAVAICACCMMRVRRTTTSGTSCTTPSRMTSHLDTGRSLCT